MLIDLDVLEITEIFEFLEDADLLKERINEAKELIETENQEAANWEPILVVIFFIFMNEQWSS